jgi:hypothetical protein
LDFYSASSLKQVGGKTCRSIKETLSWLKANQSLLFLLNAARLAKKQQIPVLLSLVCPKPNLNPWSTTLDCWVDVKQWSLTHSMYHGRWHYTGLPVFMNQFAIYSDILYPAHFDVYLMQLYVIKFSVTCDRSVVFSGYSGFLQQKNCLPRYSKILLKVALNTITLTLTTIWSRRPSVKSDCKKNFN